MSNKKASIKDLIRKRNALLKKFEQYSDFARGSITSVCSTCNRAGCICENKTPARAYRLTYKDSQQKTRTVYVPRNRLPKIKRLIANYTKARDVIEQLIETNIELFKRETEN
jgi:hypothetical protein